MLDVHPPHQAAHTWKDFLIHIATIVIGLLIAIGLEQTVEAIHHANERRQLIAELREEAQSNHLTLQKDINILLSEAEWDAAAIAVLDHAAAKDGVVQVELPAHKGFGHNRAPYRSTWTIATNNGTAALLPKERAQAYELMDRDAALLQTATEARNTAAVEMRRLELKLQMRLVSGSRLTISDREVPALVESFASRAAALQAEAERDAILAGYCESVANDIFDPRRVGDFIAKNANAVVDRTGWGF